MINISHVTVFVQEPSAGVRVCECGRGIIAKGKNLKTGTTKRLYHKFGRSFVHVGIDKRTRRT